MKKIVIDPGHGGSDPGAVGKSGLRESDVALKVSLKVEMILSDLGFSVRLTRPSNTYVPLRTRAEIANHEQADLFVSVHCNAAENKSAQGVETFHYPTSKNGKVLAEILQERLVGLGGRKNRGVKTANFLVLRETFMPAVLVELGFISNSEEESVLNSNSYQEICANAIAQAVRRYFEDEG